MCPCVKEAVSCSALGFRPALTPQYTCTAPELLPPVQSMPLLFMNALNNVAIRQEAYVFRGVAKAALTFSHNDFCQRPELLDCLLISRFDPIFSLALSVLESRPCRHEETQAARVDLHLPPV